MSDLYSRTEREIETTAFVEEEFNKHMDEFESKSHDPTKKNLKEFLEDQLHPDRGDTTEELDEIAGKIKAEEKLQRVNTIDVTRDNLKYKTMAQYKAVQDGEM